MVINRLADVIKTDFENTVVLILRSWHTRDLLLLSQELHGDECVNLYEILGQKTTAYIDFENDHRNLRGACITCGVHR